MLRATEANQETADANEYTSYSLREDLGSTQPLQPLLLFRLQLQTPGTLAVEKAHACLGGNSVLGWKQARKSTVETTLWPRHPDGKPQPLPGHTSVPATLTTSAVFLGSSRRLCSTVYYLSGVLASTKWKEDIQREPNHHLSWRSLRNWGIQEPMQIQLIFWLCDVFLSLGKALRTPWLLTAIAH